MTTSSTNAFTVLMKSRKRSASLRIKQPTKNSSLNAPNAFTQLMNSRNISPSSCVCRPPCKGKKEQFHLHNLNGDVSWESHDKLTARCSPTYNSDTIDEEKDKVDLGRPANSFSSPHPIDTKPHTIDTVKQSQVCFAEKNCKWTSEVFVKRRKNEKINGCLELTLSSSILSSSHLRDDHSSSDRRLVKHHSKLSVPVLKSILQKSIRRRRPLPAVRVAMELADKSWGDLVRRVPIIILEDSILHPDFPLLVWLMAAESKGFVPPICLISRVMQIIFEVSSCPWKDFLGGDISKKEYDEGPLTSLYQLNNEDETIDNECKLVLRSILLRRQYGGMDCDLQMLDKYVKLWMGRYREGVVHSHAEYSFFSKENAPYLWKHVPKLIHRSIRENQSSKLIPPLIINREKMFEGLVLSDIPFAGIDFHCSNILESMILSETTRNAISSRLVETETDRIMQVLKTCMWHFSSGVNNRRPFLNSDVKAEKLPSKLNTLWNEILLHHVEIYVLKYITAKLVVNKRS